MVGNYEKGRVFSLIDHPKGQNAIVENITNGSGASIAISVQEIAKTLQIPDSMVIVGLEFQIMANGYAFVPVRPFSQDNQ